MTEGRHKDPKQGPRPHTGMIEFKYSKIFEDYLRYKTGKCDVEVQNKLNPKRDAICVVLYNIQDDLHSDHKDISVDSYILRSGNFGVPQVPSNFYSVSRQESAFGALPTIDESQPSVVARSFTELNLRDSALGIHPRVSQSRQSLDKISLPSIKGRPQLAVNRRKLLGSTSLNADKKFVPRPPATPKRQPGQIMVWRETDSVWVWRSQTHSVGNTQRRPAG